MKGKGCNKPAIVEDKKQSSINRLKIHNKGNKNERETSGDLNQGGRRPTTTWRRTTHTTPGGRRPTTT